MSTPDEGPIAEQVLRLRDRLVERGVPSVSPGRAALSDSDALVQRLRPFVRVMLLVMTADGEVHDSERDAVRGAVRTLTDGHASSAVIDRLLSELEVDVRALGRQRCLEQSAAQLCGSRDDAELALVLTAAVAAADGDGAVSEWPLVVELAELLGIAGERRSELVGALG
jgi:tellurite resistance protein